MVSYRTRGIYSLCLFAQIIGVSILFWLWLPVSQGGLHFTQFGSRYAIYNAMILLGLVVAFKPSNVIRNDIWNASRHAIRQTFLAFAFLGVFLIGSKDAMISRLFLFTFLPLLFALLLLLHYYLPTSLARITFSGAHEERVLLIGSTKNIAFLQNWIESKESVGYVTIGILSDDARTSEVEGYKVLGGFDDIERTVREWSITQVVLVEFPLFSNVLSNCASICEKLGVRFLVFCDFESKFHHSITMFEDEGLRFISLRQEPLEDPFNRFCKRALDIIVAMPVILFVLPFTTLVVWFFQKLQSPGPVFHSQPRAGLQNRPFQILKYRTMNVGNFSQAKQATTNDPRIYPAGRWFRKLSIDELPQFWNVLRGEMSVVGPRPHLLEHNEQFARALHNYHVRAQIKPGITGLAQVKGFRGETRTQEDVVQRVKADIFYLENWSLSLDTWIIFQTYFQVFAPPKSAK
ncbi:MAG: exopolysaccharide biosynthesis polyprenyl glycosylphosphotransferase [Verrucomicrobiota bacterium]|nr:exopolysaccharide biosynthesis polyprenyl glycosylphosphotransferase [Verrucomicrobiota bacterium]